MKPAMAQQHFKWRGIISVLLFLSIPVEGLAGADWRITSLEWPPYSGAKLTGQGIAIKKLHCILQQQGVGLTVDFYPWKRARLLARGEKYNGYFPAWPDEVDPGFHTGPDVMYSRVALVGNKLRKFSDLKSLKSYLSRYRVGVVDGYNYPGFITEQVNRNPDNVDHSRTDASLIRKLNAGRFDLALSDPWVMGYYSREEGTQIQVVRDLGAVPLVMAISDKDELAFLKYAIEVFDPLKCP